MGSVGVAAGRVKNLKRALPRKGRAGSVASVYHVHVFLATGEAKSKNEVGCRAGELHSLLIFSRQPAGAPADQALARRGAAFAGWKHVKLERSRRVEAVPADPDVKAAYGDALELGCSVLADRRALAPARRTRKRERRGKERKA